MLISQKTSDATINLVLDTLLKGKQALVFCGSKAGCEKQAEDIARKLKEVVALEISEEARGVLSTPTKQCLRLAKCLEKGIAFHHSGLHSKQRSLIEDSFKEGKVSIICCTPTLAAGLDMPAFRTILRDLKRYGGRFGMQYIPVLEYLQMAGRAGRPGHEDYGESIAVAKGEGAFDEIWERYVLGEPEDIHSKLAVEPVLRTYLLSLISTGLVRNKEQIMDFFGDTFWAQQFGDMQELGRIIEKMLRYLIEWKFLQGQSDDFVSADSMDSGAYVATPLGRRVTELYIDPLTAHEMIVALDRASSLKNISFLHMISCMNEMQPLLRVKSKEWDDVQEEMLKYHQYLLVEEPNLYDPGYDDYINAFKTALMMEAWCEEKRDDYLMDQFNCRPGETRAKIDRGEWLLRCASELARLIGRQEMVAELNKAGMRLKHGVREELLPLMKLDQVGRVRARKLYANGMKTAKELKACDLGSLEQLMGVKIAAHIKRQLGEKVVEKSGRERKGQIGLGKWSA